MAKLDAKKRNSLPSSAFVFPKERAFPIHDLAHARAALRLSGRVSPEKRKRVIAVVCARWGSQIPACPKGKAKGKGSY